jgi:hypothetical protein
MVCMKFPFHLKLKNTPSNPCLLGRKYQPEKLDENSYVR